MYLHSDWKVLVSGEMRLQHNDLKVGTDHFPIGGLDHQGPVARVMCRDPLHPHTHLGIAITGVPEELGFKK